MMSDTSLGQCDVAVNVSTADLDLMTGNPGMVAVALLVDV